ncbi:MAG: FAD synthetase family protein [Ruminococcaceae bacterium]|nr:FAD synthetase family protein [Oscillospiraceae bacterium]
MNDRYVLALGYFDGIHLGHQALLRRTAERAAELGARSAVITFDVHPDTLVHGCSVPLINHDADRVALIRRMSGIEDVYFIPFTRDTMKTPWRDFLITLEMHCSAAGYVVGHDFRFGYRGEGNGEKLLRYGAENALSVDVIDAVTVDGHIASSTYIRELLERGDIAAANRVLGHPHWLTGHAREGFLPWHEGLQTLPEGHYTTRVNGTDCVLTAEGNGLRGDMLCGEVTIEFYGAL